MERTRGRTAEGRADYEVEHVEPWAEVQVQALFRPRGQDSLFDSEQLNAGDVVCEQLWVGAHSRGYLRAHTDGRAAAGVWGRASVARARLDSRPAGPG